MQQVSIVFAVELRRWPVMAAACIMECLVDLLEQDIHLLRPLLPVLLPGSFKFVQVACVAEGVHQAIIEIGFPVIMTEDSLVVWQNPHLVQRRLAVSE
jgi:hypothetical protein